MVFFVFCECGCCFITSFLFVSWVAFWVQVDFWLLLGCGMFSFCCTTILNSLVVGVVHIKKIGLREPDFWGLALSVGFVGKR